MVDPTALEGPVWLRRHVGPFAGVDIDSRETFFVLRDVVHEVDPAGRTELEVAQTEREADSLWNRLAWITTIVKLLVVVLCVVSGLLLVRSLMRPIKLLT